MSACTRCTGKGRLCLQVLGCRQACSIAPSTHMDRMARPPHRQNPVPPPLQPASAHAEAKAELLQFMRSTSAASRAAPALSLTPTGAVVRARLCCCCLAAAPGSVCNRLRLHICSRMHGRWPAPCFLALMWEGGRFHKLAASSARDSTQHTCPERPALQVTAGGQTLGEQQLTDRLLSLLSGVEAAPEALSLEGALRRPPPAAQRDDDSRLPLTW